MFSVKTKDPKGNLQLTIAPGTHPFYIHQLLCYANPTVQIGYDLKAKP